MSERGSFVTEFIYCKACYEAACGVLLAKEKYLYSIEVLAESSNPRVCQWGIIAGKVGGLYAGEEIDAMAELLYVLKPRLCEGHDITVAVIPDAGGRLLSLAGYTQATFLCTDSLPPRAPRQEPVEGQRPPPWWRRPNALDGVPDEIWRGWIE